MDFDPICLEQEGGGGGGGGTTARGPALFRDRFMVASVLDEPVFTRIQWKLKNNVSDSTHGVEKK